MMNENNTNEDSNMVMKKLMKKGRFKKEDFYREIRPYVEEPGQVIDLWQRTRDEYLEVGWIERKGYETYQKREEPEEPEE